MLEVGIQVFAINDTMTISFSHTALGGIYLYECLNTLGYTNLPNIALEILGNSREPTFVWLEENF